MNYCGTIRSLPKPNSYTTDAVLEFTMTSLTRSILAIPSHALDDLPKSIGSTAAADFLTAWTAQWDPRLIAALAGLPEWKRADTGSLDVSSSLVIVPDISIPSLDRPLRERLELQGCVIVQSQQQSRDTLVRSLLTAIQPNPSGQTTDDPPAATPCLLDDFYALGYAILQIQILAKKLHYSTNIDWIVFHEQLVQAAQGSLAGEPAETERWIQACFDSVSQERDRYCSQQAYLLDTVLLADTTLSKRLDDQLQRAHPFNVIASASLLDTLKSHNPDAWNTLVGRIADGTVNIVGGAKEECYHPHLTLGGLCRDLARGQRAYRELGIDPPKVYTRYRPGFSATLPTLLNQFGYRGTLLAVWSAGTLPEKDQAKIRWQSVDSSPAIDCVLGHVLDASNAESFLYLANDLAKQLDYHHVPTLILAHWPNQVVAPFDDLIRCMQRTPALGKFASVDQYFTSTGHPYSNDAFVTSAFKGPIPESAKGQNEMALRLQRHATHAAHAERLVSNYWLWNALTSFAYPNHSTALRSLQPAVESIPENVDRVADCVEQDADLTTELATHIDTLSQHQLRVLCDCLCGSSEPVSSTAPQGWLLVNPAGHTRRYFLDGIPGSIQSGSNERIYATELRDGLSKAIIDVPPFGFVKFATDPIGSSSASTPPTSPSLWRRLSGTRMGVASTDWTLANEFLEIQIDPRRGHLRSVYVANKRGSRMSGMLSLVPRAWDVTQRIDEAALIELSSVQMRIIDNSDLRGTIEVTGEFVDGQGNRFPSVTRYTLWKGARWLDIKISIGGLSPNQCFGIWRTAWLNEGAVTSSWMHGVKGKLNGPLQTAVELIEIDDAENRIYLAPRGLAAHRRMESRFLATYLPIDGEGTANSEFALGLDWQRPYDTAIDLLDRPMIAPVRADQFSKGALDHAWMAQCTLPNVTFHWTDPGPVLESRPSSGPLEIGSDGLPDSQPQDESLESGITGDACVLAVETQGKPGTARFRFFRDVAQAWRVDRQGREFETLTVADGQIQLSMRANDCARILIRWTDEST